MFLYEECVAYPMGRIFSSPSEWALIFYCAMQYNFYAYTLDILIESYLSLSLKIDMEPGSRIELPTSSLPRKRSTTELPRLSFIRSRSLSFGLPAFLTNLTERESYNHGGERRSRTFEGWAVRFTVWSLWPLGNLPYFIILGYSLELHFIWSWQWDLNPQPADYKSAALPNWAMPAK